MDFSIFSLYPVYRSGTPYVHSMGLDPLQQRHVRVRDIAKMWQFREFHLDERDMRNIQRIPGGDMAE
jgi:hypothetical protein